MLGGTKIVLGLSFEVNITQQAHDMTSPQELSDLMKLSFNQTMLVSYFQTSTATCIRLQGLTTEEVE